MMTRRIARFATIAAIGIFLGSNAAYAAFASADECNAKANETENLLIKANVTNEQLHQFAGEIETARGMCTSGDLAGAEAQLTTTAAAISAASGN